MISSTHNFSSGLSTPFETRCHPRHGHQDLPPVQHSLITFHAYSPINASSRTKAPDYNIVHLESFFRRVLCRCRVLSLRCDCPCISSSSILGAAVLSLRIICLQRSMKTSSTFAVALSFAFVIGMGEAYLDVVPKSRNTVRFPSFVIHQMPSLLILPGLLPGRTCCRQ
jgi:hypothetical protein